jgi:8-oxo-dGTP pyrophosphatase MutT (NUDIX family)
MKRAMRRIPRDVSVQLFRREGDSLRFLMLKRTVARGGFWQGVTGAPLRGETDKAAALREVREETGTSQRASNRLASATPTRCTTVYAIGGIGSTART